MRVLLPLVLLALVPWLQAQGSPARDELDVLLVVSDDVHWTDLADVPTPSLDRLAAQGVRMLGHHSMPVCAPSRHALWHGRWPRRSAIGAGVNSYLPPGAENPTPPSELVSLPKLLKARGYRTCLVGKWHLGQASWSGDAASAGDLAAAYGPHGHGFDRWLAGSPANLSARGSSYHDWQRIDDGVVSQEQTYATYAMVEAARAWWLDTEGPKLLALCLTAPHEPFHDPPPELVPGYSAPPRNRRQQYLQMVGTVDWALGRMLEIVDPGRTLVVFVADNGTPPGINGSGERAKGTTLQRGVNVPLILRGPGVHHGSSSALVSMVDIPASVYELATGRSFQEVQPAKAGLGFEDAWSFAGLISPLAPGDGRPTRRRWLMAETYDPIEDDLMVRTERWKLRTYYHARRGPRGGPIEFEHLYDLEADPFEGSPIDLAGTLSAEQAEAAHLLRRIRDEELPPRAKP
jgi:arylsulfatase A-like enzyme